MARHTFVIALAAFAAALSLRLYNAAAAPDISPVDEAYQLKRMTYSAAHFPRVLEFDSDRGLHGAFCPWPPLYDLTFGGLARLMGATTRDAVQRRVVWFPPIAFALFVAVAFVWLERRFGLVAALAATMALAGSPYTVTNSAVGCIDHHWLEAILVYGIVAAVISTLGAPASRRLAWRRPAAALTLALLAAMFVQTALIVAVGLAFAAIFFFSAPGRRRASRRDDGAPLIAAAFAFAIGAAVIFLYRLTRPPGYPDNAWFLGWTHAALFGAAAVACAYLAWKGNRVFALLAGACVVLATPSAPMTLLAGSTFFGGEPWLHVIVEFQPLWRAHADDLASILPGLGAGALFVWPLAVRAWKTRDPIRGTVALFAIVYLLLTITSRRFWSMSIPLLALAGALYADALGRRAVRWVALAAVALLPITQFGLWMTQPVFGPIYGGARSWMRAARFLHTQPPGRLLGPWSWGHLIDVYGERAVVIDNFGTMPGETTFYRAQDMYLTTHEETLANYCRDNGVRLIAFDPPPDMRSAATILGLNAAYYDKSKLARRTVWWRAYHGEPLRHFRRIYAAYGVVICRYQP